MYELTKTLKPELGKYLRPVEGTDSIVTLDEELAEPLIGALRGAGEDLIRFGKVYFGKYGIFGYVESRHSFLDNRRAEVWAVFEMPETLLEKLGEVRGLKGFVKDYFFMDKELTREQLDHPNLRDIPLIDSGYYFIVTDRSYALWSGFTDDLKEMEEKIRNRITDLESKLDMFVPEDKRPDFSSLYFEGLPEIE